MKALGHFLKHLFTLCILMIIVSCSEDSPDSKSLYQAAEKAHQRGDYAGAIEMYTESISMIPEYTPADTDEKYIREARGRLAQNNHLGLHHAYIATQNFNKAFSEILIAEDINIYEAFDTRTERKHQMHYKDESVLRYKVCNTLFEMERYDEALICATSALENKSIRVKQGAEDLYKLKAETFKTLDNNEMYLKTLYVGYMKGSILDTDVKKILVKNGYHEQLKTCYELGYRRVERGDLPEICESDSRYSEGYSTRKESERKQAQKDLHNSGCSELCAAKFSNDPINFSTCIEACRL